MGRHANPDVLNAFVEVAAGEGSGRCTRVRCVYCGYTRAKNTTRQIEHLQRCTAHADITDSTAAHDDDDLSHSSPLRDRTARLHHENTNEAFLDGTRPHPSLQVRRKGVTTRTDSPRNRKRRHADSNDDDDDDEEIAMSTPPALTTRLLDDNADAVKAATQQPFLKHAGEGTLARQSLEHWLTQDAHYARGYINFIGALIAKVPLPAGRDKESHLAYRVMDLLISALNNIRRELSFFEETAGSYQLTVADQPPTPMCRAYLDLFGRAASPSASLLEGLLVLWATEYCYLHAWANAKTFMPRSTQASRNDTSHIAALHQEFIPNWTSEPFSKFIDASRALVDELAEQQTTSGSDGDAAAAVPTGNVLVQRCVETFRQICWLEERFWPEVNEEGQAVE